MAISLAKNRIRKLEELPGVSIIHAVYHQGAIVAITVHNDAVASGELIHWVDGVNITCQTGHLSDVA